MITKTQKLTVMLLATIAIVFSTPLQAELISNGGFESGFTGWTVVDQLGSDGTFFVQSGTSSPIIDNGIAVPLPPEGTKAAMTDAQAGGGHVIYQDFTVPNGFVSGHIGFSLFLNNTADKFYTPSNLDWAATNTPGSANLNQQARVDILSPSADVFGVTVLQNLFQTNEGDPLVSGYTPFLIDISSLLQSHQGETLRLRFAEIDNVNLFNFGVDNVTLTTPVPLPPSFSLALSGFAGIFWGSRRRNKHPA